MIDLKIEILGGKPVANMYGKERAVSIVPDGT
jgi:hypothetical protein